MTESHLTIEDARRLRDLAMVVRKAAHEKGMLAMSTFVTDDERASAEAAYVDTRHRMLSAISELTGEPIT